MTFEVSKLLKSIYFNDQQSSNIAFISTIDVVTKLDKSIEVNFPQVSNIKDIFVTEDESKFLKFTDVKEVQC